MEKGFRHYHKFIYGDSCSSDDTPRVSRDRADVERATAAGLCSLALSHRDSHD